MVLWILLVLMTISVMINANQCIFPLCESVDTGECVDSIAPIRCKECSWNGFRIAPNTCECYDPILLPHKECTFPTHLSSSIQTLTLEWTEKKVSCESFQDKNLGCFRAVDSSKHRYGDPNPPVPTECCLSFLGPPPNQLVEIAKAGDALGECTTVGGPDKDTPLDQSFHLCSRHGKWNAEKRICECDEGWDVEEVGIDQLNDPPKPAETCQGCFGYFGPLPGTPMDQEQPPYCRAIYTPDPITGRDAQCGGRGDYVDHHCTCFANATIGYWKLGLVRGKRNKLGEELVVESCVLCADGWGTWPNCLTRIPNTTSPTLAPTPLSTLRCPLGGTSLGSVVPTGNQTKVVMPMNGMNTTCCDAVFAPQTTTLIGGTCMDSEENRNHLGESLCGLLMDGCCIWNWQLMELEDGTSVHYAYQLFGADVIPTHFLTVGESSFAMSGRSRCLLETTQI